MSEKQPDNQDRSLVLVDDSVNRALVPFTPAVTLRHARATEQTAEATVAAPNFILVDDTPEAEATAAPVAEASEPIKDLSSHGGTNVNYDRNGFERPAPAGLNPKLMHGTQNEDGFGNWERPGRINTGYAASVAPVAPVLAAAAPTATRRFSYPEGDAQRRATTFGGRPEASGAEAREEVVAAEAGAQAVAASVNTGGDLHVEHALDVRSADAEDADPATLVLVRNGAAPAAATTTSTATRARTPRAASPAASAATARRSAQGQPSAVPVAAAPASTGQRRPARGVAHGAAFNTVMHNHFGPGHRLETLRNVVFSPYTLGRAALRYRFDHKVGRNAAANLRDGGIHTPTPDQLHEEAEGHVRPRLIDRGLVARARRTARAAANGLGNSADTFMHDVHDTWANVREDFGNTVEGYLTGLRQRQAASRAAATDRDTSQTRRAAAQARRNAARPQGPVRRATPAPAPRPAPRAARRNGTTRIVNPSGTPVSRV